MGDPIGARNPRFSQPRDYSPFSPCFGWPGYGHRSRRRPGNARGRTPCLQYHPSDRPATDQSTRRGEASHDANTEHPTAPVATTPHLSHPSIGAANPDCCCPIEPPWRTRRCHASPPATLPPLAATGRPGGIQASCSTKPPNSATTFPKPLGTDSVAIPSLTFSLPRPRERSQGPPGCAAGRPGG